MASIFEKNFHDKIKIIATVYATICYENYFLLYFILEFAVLELHQSGGTKVAVVEDFDESGLFKKSASRITDNSPT